MKKIAIGKFLGLFLCGAFLLQAESYWLIQQDFIKLGKKDLYEEQLQKIQKKQRGDFIKKKQQFSVMGMEDLENPRTVLLMPVQDLSSLSLYPPFLSQEKEALFNTCLNFQIFSLHAFLEEGSKSIQKTFVGSRPYYYYVFYDVVPGGQVLMEEALRKAVSSSSELWCAWKSLIAGDGPSYLVCLSFETKEQLKEWSMEKLLEEGSLKEILRGKKSGWMKKEDKLSIP